MKLRSILCMGLVLSVLSSGCGASKNDSPKEMVGSEFVTETESRNEESEPLESTSLESTSLESETSKANEFVPPYKLSDFDTDERFVQNGGLQFRINGAEKLDFPIRAGELNEKMADILVDKLQDNAILDPGETQTVYLNVKGDNWQELGEDYPRLHIEITNFSDAPCKQSDAWVTKIQDEGCESLVIMELYTGAKKSGVKDSLWKYNVYKNHMDVELYDKEANKFVVDTTVTDEQLKILSVEYQRATEKTIMESQQESEEALDASIVDSDFSSMLKYKMKELLGKNLELMDTYTYSLEAADYTADVIFSKADNGTKYELRKGNLWTQFYTNGTRCIEVYDGEIREPQNNMVPEIESDFKYVKDAFNAVFLEEPGESQEYEIINTDFRYIIAQKGYIVNPTVKASCELKYKDGNRSNVELLIGENTYKNLENGEDIPFWEPVGANLVLNDKTVQYKLYFRLSSILFSLQNDREISYTKEFPQQVTDYFAETE